MEVASSVRKQGDLFTASQIARFCQVDLKTIHNWADRGQIPHFRTPGRHLRFRRAHVLDFLRKYGYPIPSELDASRPRVALLVAEEETSEPIAQALRKSFEVITYPSPVMALLGIGEQPPDAIVLAVNLGPLTAAAVIEALANARHTKHVRAVLLTQSQADGASAMIAGASAHVRCADVTGLRDTLEALMGVRH